MTAAVLLALACTLSADVETDKSRPLFNGQNLSGFYTFLERHGKNNDPDKVFSVADGMIRISGQEFGFLATEQEFENYHLTVEFKWGTQTHPPRKDRARDSGILFHFTGPDKVWPQSIEFQLFEGGTGDLILVGAPASITTNASGRASCPGPSSRPMASTSSAARSAVINTGASARTRPVSATRRTWKNLMASGTSSR